MASQDRVSVIEHEETNGVKIIRRTTDLPGYTESYEAIIPKGDMKKVATQLADELDMAVVPEEDKAAIDHARRVLCEDAGDG
jgi:hypothetical protein